MSTDISGKPARTKRETDDGRVHEVNEEEDEHDYVNERPRRLRRSGSQETQQETQRDLVIQRAIVRACAVCLTLLFLLMAVRTVDKAMDCDYMTEDEDQLQISFEQLEISHSNLTVENVQLQIRFEQLKIRYKNVTEERDALKRKLCEPHGFTFAGGLCYYLSTETKDWEQSRQWCIDKQSDLMVIKSKEKQDFVVSLKQIVWLGLTDRDQEGVWKWVDGTNLTTPTFWYPGEPNDPDGNEDCAETYPNGWNDRSCGYATRFFICERVI